MSPHGGDFGRFQTAGPPANDPDLLWLIALCESELRLIARLWVDGTPHRVFSQGLDTPIARKTGENLFEAPLRSLSRQEGIGNQGSAHGDKVGLSLPNNLIGHDRVSDPPDRDHRDVHHRLDGLGEMDKDPLFGIIGRLVQVA